jgi:hypothetical protein
LQSDDEIESGRVGTPLLDLRWGEEPLAAEEEEEEGEEEEKEVGGWASRTIVQLTRFKVQRSC